MALGRNAMYNLMGSGVPLLVALVTVPLYIHAVGIDRYGVLTIAWIILGYFGFFDLGLGRATAQAIAANAGQSDAVRSNIFWTAMGINVGLGLAGGVVLYLVGVYFFADHLETTDALRREALMAVPLLALAVPILTATGVASGTLQGREMFLSMNKIALTTTVLFQVLPLAVAYLIGPSLPGLVAAAVAARGFGLLLFWITVWRSQLRGHAPHFDRDRARALFGFGGWVSLTSLTSPLLVTADRMLIGSILGTQAVGVYNVPFQISSRLAILPASVTNALYPRIAYNDPVAVNDIWILSIRSFLALMTPLVVGLIFVMEPALKLWVGNDIGQQAYPIGQVLMMGFWGNALALVPFTVLQGRGEPRKVAFSLYLQIPFYLGALVLAMKSFGLIGAASVFAARCIVDYLILSAFAGRIHAVGASLIAFAHVAAAMVLSQLYAAHPVAWAAAMVAVLASSTVLAWIVAPPRVRALVGVQVQRVLGDRTPRWLTRDMTKEA